MKKLILNFRHWLEYFSDYFIPTKKRKNNFQLVLILICTMRKIKKRWVNRLIDVYLTNKLYFFYYCIGIKAPSAAAS